MQHAKCRSAISREIDEFTRFVKDGIVIEQFAAA
jgi:hypothetical protein